MKKEVFIGMVIIISIALLGVVLYKWDFKTTIIIAKDQIQIGNITDENINIKTLQARSNITIEKQGINSVKINGKELNGKMNLEISNINVESKIKVEITNLFGKTKKYYINTFPDDFPEYEVKGESKYEGDYYLTTYSVGGGPSYVFKLNEKGEMIYYKKADNLVFDFKKDIIDNKIRYSYLEAVEGEMDTKSVSYYPTKLVIMDENYEVINEVRYLNEDGTKQPLENHGALLLEDNHYILPSFKEIEVDNIEGKEESTKITDNLIEEVKDGKIIWQFRTSNYPELYKYCSTGAFNTKNRNNYADYVHYNSSAIDKNDGNLLCSFRNIDAILKINRQTGELMWILGGEGDQFNLTQDQKFSKQHAIEYLEDGAILIFDNRDVGEKSRIIKIKLDEENKKVSKYENYDLKVNSQFMGSAIPIEEDCNTYTICYGGGNFKVPVVEEKNVQTGEVYFSVEMLKTKYLYRVYKIK